VWGGVPVQLVLFAKSLVLEEGIGGKTNTGRVTGRISIQSPVSGAHAGHKKRDVGGGLDEKSEVDTHHCTWGRDERGNHCTGLKAWGGVENKSRKLGIGERREKSGLKTVSRILNPN